MTRTGPLAWVLWTTSAVLMVACGGGGKATTGTGGKSGVCTMGAETCGCYGNGTCDADLLCASGLCVRPGGSGGGPAPAGSGGATGGAGAGGTGGGGMTGSGGSSACPAGAETCACYGNGTCNASLTCASNICVKLGGGGATGSGSGGMVGTGTGGKAAATGGASGDSCNGAPASTIDNFATCDLNACDVGGKHGTWFGYADNGINLDFAVRVPPTAWAWQACSAVVTGGPRTSGSTAYAGIGVTLNATNAYDVSGYTGLRFRLESAARVWVAVEMSDGGRFGAYAPASNAVIRDVSFASMIAQADSSTATKNLTLVKQVVFTPEDPSMGFGFLVGELSLY